MIRKEKKGICWLEFDLLTDRPEIKHATFLRHGGFSAGPYASLNMGDRIGDDPTVVENNRKIALDILGVSKVAWLCQCHGKAIHQVSVKDSSPPLQGDALTTSDSSIGLLIGHGDCQAAIFYDPVHHAISNVHSGWRGSVQNIYSETIQYMAKAYGTRPADLIVCISPSLGPLSSQFVNYRKELPEIFWPYQVKPDYFDFWAISRMQLIDCGVLDAHIEIACMDTYANEKDFYSYRRDGVTGRHATIVSLN